MYTKIMQAIDVEKYGHKKLLGAIELFCRWRMDQKDTVT